MNYFSKDEPECAATTLKTILLSFAILYGMEELKSNISELLQSEEITSCFGEATNVK